ncbi:MAG: TetR/AcrR family transcriptional regulator [Sphingomonadaceae bacterium]
MTPPRPQQSGAADRETKRRLSGAERSAELLKSAARLIVRQGHLPLSLEALGRDAGVSKALIYVYFPTQSDIANQLLREQLSFLERAEVLAALADSDFERGAQDFALHYLGLIAREGPLLHILLADAYLRGQLADDVRLRRDRLARHVAKRLRAELALGAADSVALVNLLAAIPEQAGRMAFNGALVLADAQDLCSQILASSLRSLRVQR